MCDTFKINKQDTTRECKCTDRPAETNSGRRLQQATGGSGIFSITVVIEFQVPLSQEALESHVLRLAQRGKLLDGYTPLAAIACFHPFSRCS
jgi:hypothetical protein